MKRNGSRSGARKYCKKCRNTERRDEKVQNERRVQEKDGNDTSLKQTPSFMARNILGVCYLSTFIKTLKPQSHFVLVLKLRYN